MHTARHENPRRYIPAAPRYIPARRTPAPFAPSCLSESRLGAKSGAKCDRGVNGTLAGAGICYPGYPRLLHGRMNELALPAFHSFCQLHVASAKDGSGPEEGSGGRP